ncbi:unnamed protein product [Ambrosiozyma monospora]|uniref:rRNA biogenesis protein RRP36 n=1 Tax=Ambrosiozyma monospora TaxID=43982 RepID=A0A9W6WII0_AMBMO|nr:unnamed protein product [Ambrosiozyma monospora]
MIQVQRLGSLKEKTHIIPGLLENTKYQKSSKYRDIRFESGLGSAREVNETEFLKNYKFLNDYRKSEFEELKKLIKDQQTGKLKNVEDWQVRDWKDQVEFLRSKINKVESKVFEKDVLKNYKKENDKKWLSQKEKHKVVEVAKFDKLGSRQRERVMERKRKKKLGREMRRFEFGGKK